MLQVTGVVCMKKNTLVIGNRCLRRECAVVFPLEDQSRRLWRHEMDVTRISRAIEGGNYKRKAQHKPRGCRLGLLILNVWVYQQAIDPLLRLSGCLSLYDYTKYAFSHVFM